MQKIFKTAGMLVLLLLTVSSFAAVPTPTPNNKKLTLEQLKLFGDIFERVRAGYVEPVEDEKLIEYAINGMLSGLDPHSSYLNAENFKEIKMHTKGEFGGLGMELTLDRGLIKVLSPIDDTPAFKAGIKPGDYITAVDGQSIIGLGFSDAVKMMRGEPNTSIALTIVRQDTQDPIEVKMKRAIIKVNPVRAQLYDDILYLRIASFTEKTASSLKDEIKKYITEAEQKASAKGILLDLRNNPGGLLEQAIEVSDVFLPAGEIVSTKGRNKEDVKRYNASGKNLVNNIPMVILINGGTASASEIVAGALQDHKKALIVGTKSFGKGSVQSIMPFQNNVAIRLTIARYYTPSGRSIQAEGIMPDVVLDSAKIEFVNNNKLSYKEADLPKHLQNKQSEKKPEEELSRVRQGIYANDYQLGMAYDIVKSIVIYRAM